MPHEVIKTNVPEEIREYIPELSYFFQNMVQKLNINRHKGFCDNETMLSLLESLRMEYVELIEAVRDKDQFNAYMESVDVANFAWLFSVLALRLTKEEYEKMRHSMRAHETATHTESGMRDTHMA